VTAPTYFTDVEINGRWRMQLPDFRALRYLQAGPLGWERERIASMAVNLNATDVLLDVGAESGDMTALFARWVNNVRIMEPNPTAWPNIKAIFDANGLHAPAAHWVGFASDSTGSVTHPAATLDGAGTGWPACVDGPVVAAHGFRHLAEHYDITPQLTIDDFTARTGIPTAVTMDIEGAELLALQGARRLLTEHRPLVWVSVHPSQIRGFGHRPVDVYQLLESYDYRVTHLADDHETHIFAEPR
jgi:FkbM family methyltransferase